MQCMIGEHSLIHHRCSTIAMLQQTETCACADDLPYIPPDVHTDTATLHTSIVRLLPYIQGMQYHVIAMCMKEVGMHNFMRILQALSRTATEKAAKEAAELAKPPPASLAGSEKPAQKRRTKRSTAAFKPLSARQLSGSDVARDSAGGPSQSGHNGSTTDKGAPGAPPEAAEPTGGHSTASLPAASGAASTAETDADVSAPVESVEAAEDLSLIHI